MWLCAKQLFCRNYGLSNYDNVFYPVAASVKFSFSFKVQFFHFQHLDVLVFTKMFLQHFQAEIRTVLPFTGLVKPVLLAPRERFAPRNIPDFAQSRNSAAKELLFLTARPVRKAVPIPNPKSRYRLARPIRVTALRVKPCSNLLERFSRITARFLRITPCVSSR